MKVCLRPIILAVLLASIATSVDARYTVMLKGEHGYVGTTVSGRMEVHQDTDTRACVFHLEDHGPGNGGRLVALQDVNSGKYLVAEDDGSVYANRDQRGAWETWTMIDNGDGSFSFRSDHGQYLVGEEGHTVAANRSAVGAWERFRLERSWPQTCEDHHSEGWQRFWQQKDGKPACGPIATTAVWACQEEGLEWTFIDRPCPGDPVGLSAQPECKRWSTEGTRQCSSPEPYPVRDFAAPWITRTFAQNQDPIFFDGSGQRGRFDGSTAYIAGRYRLPPAFWLFVDMDSFDGTGRWKHLLELGTPEYGWNAPLRIETGDEGELYVGVGDGATVSDGVFQGAWDVGNGGGYRFDYADGSLEIHRDGAYLGTLVVDRDPSAADGTLIVGGHKGTERFFEGAIKVAQLGAGDERPKTGSRPVNLRAGMLDFDGTRAIHVNRGVAEYSLPQNFTVEGEINPRSAQQWVHLVELGTVQYVWNAPLRLEIGNPGEWYVSIGDGASMVEATFQGSWTPGQWVRFRVSYDEDAEVVRVYENDQHLGDLQASYTGLGGQLILGGMQGTSRFFNGQMRNLVITETPAQ